MTWPVGGGWLQDGRTFPPRWLLAPTFAFCAAHSRPGFCCPGGREGSSPHRPHSSPQGSLSLLGELEATEKNKGESMEESKRGSQVSAGWEAQQGGSNRRLQRAGACTHPEAATHQVVNPALSRMGKSLEGQPAVQGYPGDVGDEGLRSLRQPVWVHLGTVCSCRRTKPLLPHPFIVTKSSLNRETMKKIYIPSRAELEAWNLRPGRSSS